MRRFFFELPKRDGIVKIVCNFLENLLSKAVLILLLILSFGLAKSQSSQDYTSREKADRILRRFDSVKACKLVYSVSDIYYYVIFKEGRTYKEICIRTDTLGNIIKQQVVKNKKGNNALLNQALNIGDYHKNYITRVDSATVIQGNPSYFVVKDVEGNRYGEYSLPIITSPIPINKNLYKYLVTELIKCVTE